MSSSITIEVPTIDFSEIYYPDLVKLLIQYRRLNCPEITEENEYEPYVQLERAYALVGHLNNVLLDVLANESLLPTAKLLESVRNHLKLIGYILAQASPASTDVIYELSKVLTSSTLFVNQYAQCGTEETDEQEQIIFESDNAHTIDRTDELSYVFSWNSGYVEIIDNTFNAGDTITINTVAFVYAVDWSAGGTMALSAQNIADAINASTDDNLEGKIKAFVDDTKISIINFDDTSLVTISKVDGATVNFNIGDGAYSTNYATEANDSILTFTPFTDPKVGDCIFFAHKHIQFDKLTMLMDTLAANITGVWEYYDGELEDQTPTSIVNLGSNLRVDLTSFLPAGTNYAGTVVRLKLHETSAYEDCVSYYNTGVNYIDTVGVLGQSSPSIDEDDYVVGSLWQALPDIDDKTLNLTVDEDVDYTLPESTSEEWVLRTVNTTNNGYYIRFRIVTIPGAVTNPILNHIRLDEGAQYLKVATTQGVFRTEDPLGSSDGSVDQEFTLTNAPLITGSLVVEVDEGTGFTAWSLQDNFLSSNAYAKDYTIDIKADDTAIIKFGNGVRGKIPATGVDNIRSTYRTGADVNGNVGSSTITVNKAGVSFVNRLWNPRLATGWTEKEGSTEEDLARVKIEGPASIRVLDRGITPSDISYLAENYTTNTGSKLVSRATSIEETFGVKTIESIVVGTGGVQLSVSERTEMEKYFNGYKPENIDGVLVTNHEVTIVNYTKRIIDVTVTVTGGNKTLIENAIRDFIHPEAKYDDGVTYRWNFSTATNIQYFRVSLLYSVIYDVDPVAIKNVVITLPAGDVALGLRELPFYGTLLVTVV